MKVVAVSQRVDHYLNRSESRDALDQNLINFLRMATFIPVPVPNGLYKLSSDRSCGQEILSTWLGVVKPQAIVLSGGNDIGQCPERDSTEAFLLEYAFEHHMPLLGICRGMQMIAHWSGIGLQSVHGHVGTRHQLSGVIEGPANSFHGFSLVACPVDFEVLTRSEDGEIEAVRHQSLPWEGWMWHPEREENFADRDLQRIKALFGG